MRWILASTIWLTGCAGGNDASALSDMIDSAANVMTIGAKNQAEVEFVGPTGGDYWVAVVPDAEQVSAVIAAGLPANYREFLVRCVEAGPVVVVVSDEESQCVTHSRAGINQPMVVKKMPGAVTRVTLGRTERGFYIDKIE